MGIDDDRIDLDPNQAVLLPTRKREDHQLLADTKVEMKRSSRAQLNLQLAKN